MPAEGRSKLPASCVTNSAVYPSRDIRGATARRRLPGGSTMQQLHRLIAPALILPATSACSDVLEPVQPPNTFALTTVERSHLEAQLRAIVPALEAQGHPAADIMAKYGPAVASLTSQATAVSLDGSGILTHNAVGVELLVTNRDGAPDLTLRAVAIWRDTTEFYFGYSELTTSVFGDSAFGTVYERPEMFWNATDGSVSTARTSLGGTCPGVLLPAGVTCATAEFLGNLHIVTATPAALEGNTATGTRSVVLPQTALVGVRVVVDAAVFEGL